MKVRIVTWLKLHLALRSESPQRLMILTECHGVCSNNCKVSSVTNLPVLQETNKQEKETFCSPHRSGNKQATRSYVSILYLNHGKHTMVVKDRTA